MIELIYEISKKIAYAVIIIISIIYNLLYSIVNYLKPIVAKSLSSILVVITTLFILFLIYLYIL